MMNTQDIPPHRAHPRCLLIRDEVLDQIASVRAAKKQRFHQGSDLRQPNIKKGRAPRLTLVTYYTATNLN
jgi:hypothetical protein